MINATYIDLNRKFKIDGKNILNLDVTAINQSINNIIVYKKGERWMNPEFGSIIQNYLMDPVDETTATNILFALYDAVALWEPRVRVNLRLSEVAPIPEEKKFEIKLVYDIIKLNQSAEFRKVLRVK